jgi:hypothetical protein
VLKANGARVALLTPQPIEDKRPDPDQDVRNQSLRKFSDGLKDVAAKADVTFADQFDPYMAIMLHERATNPKAFIGGGDAVHPGAIGHTIMAWAILKELGASALVSRAEIDGAAKTVTAADACRIEKLKVADGVISFDRLDDALPMPIDPAAEPVFKLAPILDDLNRYELKITGLALGNYELSIDGEAVGKASRKNWGRVGTHRSQSRPDNEAGTGFVEAGARKTTIFLTDGGTSSSFHFRWAQSAQCPEFETGVLAGVEIGQDIAASEAEIEKLRNPAETSVAPILELRADFCPVNAAAAPLNAENPADIVSAILPGRFSWR